MQVRFYSRKMLLVETRRQNISKFHRNDTAVAIINENFAKHQLLCTCIINIGSFLGRPLENNNVKVSKNPSSLEHVKYDNEFFMFPIWFQDSTGD